LGSLPISTSLSWPVTCLTLQPGSLLDTIMEIGHYALGFEKCLFNMLRKKYPELWKVTWKTVCLFFYNTKQRKTLIQMKTPTD